MDGCVLKSDKPGTVGTLVVLSISSRVGLLCNNMAVTITLAECNMVPSGWVCLTSDMSVDQSSVRAEVNAIYAVLCISAIFLPRLSPPGGRLSSSGSMQSGEVRKQLAGVLTCLLRVVLL